MRLRLSYVVALPIFAAALLLGLRLRSMAGATSDPVRVPAALLDRAIRSPAFVVETDRWLDFDLPDGAERLRLLTNANLAPSALRLTDEQLSQQEWTYRVNYELLGVRGAVLDSGTYSFRTKLDRFIDPATREPFPVRFYDDRPNCLTVTQELNISCRISSQRARRLRVQLEPLEHTSRLASPNTATAEATQSPKVSLAPIEMEEVVARLFCLCDRPASHLTQSWRKLSEQQRERLTAGLVQPHERLEEQTRLNLLRTLWLPAAPSGQEGVTYEQRTLFTLHGAERFAIRPPLMESAFRVAAGHRGMLPAPAELGRMELEFQAIVPPDRFVLPESVEVFWYGAKPHERAAYLVELPKQIGGTTNIAAKLSPESNDSDAVNRITVRATKLPRGHSWSLELPSHGGLFEVVSTAPMFVRGTWQSTTLPSEVAAPIEVTPEPTVLRPYRASMTEPVEFVVAHLSDQPAPIRITARAIEPDLAESACDIGLEWRYLDERGDIVQRGPLTGESVWSEYDRFTIAPVVVTRTNPGSTEGSHTTSQHVSVASGSPTERAVTGTVLDETTLIPPRVSEPLDFYFQIPAAVHRLQIVSTGPPLLISAASRPTDIPKRTDIPEDYSAYHRRQSDNRSWFGLRAVSHLDLIEQDRAPVIVLQPRPPRDNEDLIAGRFTWRDFLPQGDWRARHLFTPRDPNQPISSDGAAFVFHELTASRTESVSFLVEPGQPTVAPTLVYRFESGTPSPLDIILNGRRHHRLVPQASSGELVLPPITATHNGAMELRIESSTPVQLWMDQLVPDQRPSWLKRLAIEATRREFTFPYRKETGDDEHLSLRLFRPTGVSARTTLHVRIESPLLTSDRPPTTTHTLTHRRFSLAPGEGPATLVLPTAATAPLDAGRVCLIPLGTDLPPGDYSIHVTIELPDAVENETTQSAAATPEQQFVIVSRTALGTTDRRDFSLEVIRESESSAETESAP